MAEHGGRYLFMGERRSATAQARGYTWASGRLCADTLHRALRAIGIDPAGQTFVNAYDDEGLPDPDGRLLALDAWREGGWVIVALGERAHRVLDGLGIAHRVLVHPAARGRIRRRDRYHAHVAAVLADQEDTGA